MRGRCKNCINCPCIEERQQGGPGFRGHVCKKVKEERKPLFRLAPILQEVRHLFPKYRKIRIQGIQEVHYYRVFGELGICLVSHL